ncbi:unnamed protein product [Auanema sp. JU1783]|nr:unnamed protein product [Auanema sp. JU1783]
MLNMESDVEPKYDSDSPSLDIIEHEDLVEIRKGRKAVSSGEPSLDGSIDEERGALSDSEIGHAARSNTIAAQVRGPSSDALEESCRIEASGRDKISEWEDILGSGNLKRKVVIPGSTEIERPKDGHWVTIRVKDTLRGMDSHERLRFITGYSMVIDAWELVVKLMYVGELCAVKTNSLLAYGKLGLDDRVPPDQDQEYTIELLEVEDGPNFEEMSERDLERFLIMLKDRGNFFFGRSEFDKAIFVASSIPFKDQEDLNILMSTIHSNLAVCYYKIGDYESVIRSADTSIMLDEYNTKALYRKAIALSALKEFDEAQKWLKRSLDIDPSQLAVQNELEKVSGLRNRRRLDEKQLYKKMLSGAGDENKNNNIVYRSWAAVNKQDYTYSLMLIRLFHSLALVACSSILVVQSSSVCSDIKPPTTLTAVSVWVKHLPETSLFRISDEDLTDEGFSRSAADRDSFIVMLSRQADACSQSNCSIKLQRNRRLRDGAELQQENPLGIPIGFETLSDDFYCARSIGDCGAELPIYRWSRGKTDDVKIYAYTFDPSASISGYIRDVVPICYGWSDEGSIIGFGSGNSVLQNNTNICARVGPVPNAKISYSVTASGLYPIGTTAILQCATDFAVSGQTSLVCTKEGWYPITGLGGCIERKTKDTHSIVSGNTAASSSSGSSCSSPSSIANGNIVAFPVANRSTANVLCSFGYIPTFFESIQCLDGEWQLPNIDRALCIKASEAKCLPPLPPMNGHVKYTSTDKNPFALNSQAQLICETGYNLVGNEMLTCKESGWSPSVLGMCQSSARSKRQGTTSLGCIAASTLGGAVSYIQTNPAVPYSAGTTALLFCDAGSRLDGAFSSICTNGQWTPVLGTCTPGGAGLPLSDSLSSGNSGATCMDMLTPLNGIVTHSLPISTGGRPSGTVATLSCNMGYTVSGSLTASCTNGIWSPTNLGTCTQGNGNSLFPSLDCATPVVTNGVVSFSRNGDTTLEKPSGTVATISCNLGFTIQGFPTSTCQGGLWSPTIPTCTTTTGVIPGIGSQMSQCTALLPPLGGTLSYSTGSIFGPYASGTTVSLTCSNQQVVSGASSAVCQSGTWSPAALGTCNLGGIGGTNCPTLITPMNGLITYSTGSALGPFTRGTTATLSCTNGALPTGSQTAMCDGTSWSPSMLGTCSTGGTGIGGQCSTLPTIMGAIITYSTLSTIGPFTSGTTATVSCTNGQMVNGVSTSVCQNGFWVPSVMGTCTNSTGTIGGQCIGGVSGPLGSTVRYSNGGVFGPYPSGTTATAICSSFGSSNTNTLTNSLNDNSIFSTGNSAFGSNTASCLNGVWNPSVLTGCQQSTGTGQCITFATRVMGTITYSTLNTGSQSVYPDGTIATLSCPSGIVGSTTSRCTSGMWTPDLGTCNSTGGLTNGTQCTTAPVSPLGSTVTYSNLGIMSPWPSGTSATMTCPLGQYPQGNSMSVCENGMWVPAMTTVCSTSSLSGNGCLPIASVLSPVTNGRAVYIPTPTERVAIGTTATLICNPTHQPSGASRITCTTTGWSPASLGQCIMQGSGNGVTCMSLLAPTNGLLTYSQGGSFGPYPTGSIAQVSCNTGYNINGVSTTTCQNGIWVPSQLGQCTPQNGNGMQCTSAIPSVALGTISYSQGSTFGPWNAGTEASLTCSPNYNPSGTVRSTCSNGVWVPSLLGTCIPSQGSLLRCQAVPFIWSGSVSYNPAGLAPYNEGTVATLSCNIGSIPSGVTTVTCQGGNWSPFPGLGSCTTTLARSPPKLARAPANTEDEKNDVVRADDQMETSDTHACPSPLAPPFGEITFSRISARNGMFSAGTTAALRCIIGYSIEGASFSTCKQGMFRPMLGKCSNGQVDPLPGACLPLAFPEHGKITYIQSSRTVKLEIGTTALLKCDDSSRAVTGTATLTCTASGWEPADGFGTCDDMRDQLVDVQMKTNIITAK